MVNKDVHIEQEAHELWHSAGFVCGKETSGRIVRGNVLGGIFWERAGNVQGIVQGYLYKSRVTCPCLRAPTYLSTPGRHTKRPSTITRLNHILVLLGAPERTTYSVAARQHRQRGTSITTRCFAWRSHSRPLHRAAHRRQGGSWRGREDTARARR